MHTHQSSMAQVAHSCTMKRRQASRGSVMLGNLGFWYLYGCYFDMYYLLKLCCSPSTLFHGTNIP